MTDNRGTYLQSVLSDLGVTKDTVGRWHRRKCMTVLLAQSKAESGLRPCNGEPDQGADNNPLNTTYDLPPCTDYNYVGVKNYQTFPQGIRATVATFNLDHYIQVRDALLNRKSSIKDICDAIAASPWGTGDLTYAVVKSFRLHPGLRRQVFDCTVGV